MSLVTKLYIIIAVLSIALIIAIIGLILQHRALKRSNRQLHWYNISSRYSGS